MGGLVSWSGGVVCTGRKKELLDSISICLTLTSMDWRWMAVGAMIFFGACLLGSQSLPRKADSTVFPSEDLVRSRFLVSNVLNECLWCKMFANLVRRMETCLVGSR